MRKKLIIFLLCIFLFITSYIIAIKSNVISESTFQKYTVAFQKYSDGIANKKLVIIIDYTLPIFKKRLWILNTKTNEILLNCHVSHAFASGIFHPSELSNEVSSNKSCAGAFLSKENYIGKYGKSMRVEGLEIGINSNARMRNIVFHPVTQFKIKGITIPGCYAYYSLGCFAVSNDNMLKIAEVVSEGSFIYVNYN